MDPEPSFLISGFFIFFLATALFSSAEVALLSLSEIDQKELKKRSKVSSNRVILLLSHQHSLFIAIRFASLMFQILLITTVIFLAKLIANYFQLTYIFALPVLLILFTAIIFGINEVWTKVVVLRNNVTFSEIVSMPIKFYFSLAKPFVRIWSRFLDFLSSRFDVSRMSTVFEHHKIMAMVENKKENGGLEENERAMINSIIEFGEIEVHEVMVPRIDIIGVEENISLKELTSIIASKGHSRIPLCSEGLDNILGIIHAKDLLPIIVNGKSGCPDLKKLARPAYFVPESKKLHHLLKEFQKEQHHMAIVIDEYGGTAGLITLEDVLEEIVGDIQDEYDKEKPLYRKIDENNFLIDAKIDLRDLNEELGTDLPTEGEYESLGGFIFSLTGHVPEENEIINFKHYTFLVKKVARNRIVQVKLTIGIAADGEIVEDVK